MSLYLFLVTVADAQGLSYYGDKAIRQYLRMNAQALSRARRELCQAGVLAHQNPIYQVLSLEDDPFSGAERSHSNQPTPRIGRSVSFSEILERVAGGTR